jgi:hypothetical protein
MREGGGQPVQEGPYQKMGSIAGVIGAAIALIAFLLGVWPSGCSGQAAPSATVPPPGTPLTSIRGTWNGSDGVTYRFVLTGNGAGSYRGEPMDGPACGPNNFQVTDQGPGLYSGTEQTYIQGGFGGCQTWDFPSITIRIAANGKTAALKVAPNSGGENVNLVRSSY